MKCMGWCVNSAWKVLESVRDSPGSVGEVGGKGVWIVFASVLSNQNALVRHVFASSFSAKGLLRELNPGPHAPEGRIIPLDQAADDTSMG